MMRLTTRYVVHVEHEGPSIDPNRSSLLIRRLPSPSGTALFSPSSNVR